MESQHNYTGCTGRSTVFLAITPFLTNGTWDADHCKTNHDVTGESLLYSGSERGSVAIIPNRLMRKDFSSWTLKSYFSFHFRNFFFFSHFPIIYVIQNPSMVDFLITKLKFVKTIYIKKFFNF